MLSPRLNTDSRVFCEQQVTAHSLVTWESPERGQIALLTLVIALFRCFQVTAHNLATWEFPELGGELRCRDADFHFWDAPDDISCANMDLVFAKDRMYLQNTTGYFGAVPLLVTGKPVAYDDFQCAQILQRTGCTCKNTTGYFGAVRLLVAGEPLP